MTVKIIFCLTFLFSGFVSSSKSETKLPNGSTAEETTMTLSRAYENDLRAVRSPIEDLDDMNDARKETVAPLIVASNIGDSKLVEQLVKEGADVNVKCSQGCTPLFVASYNGHLEVVEILLKRETVNVRCFQGYTSLFIASKNGHLEVVRALVRAGANVNMKNDQNIALLLVALQQGH